MGFFLVKFKSSIKFINKEISRKKVYLRKLYNFRHQHFPYNFNFLLKIFNTNKCLVEKDQSERESL